MWCIAQASCGSFSEGAASPGPCCQHKLMCLVLSHFWRVWVRLQPQHCKLAQDMGVHNQTELFQMVLLIPATSSSLLVCSKEDTITCFKEYMKIIIEFSLSFPSLPLNLPRALCCLQTWAISANGEAQKHLCIYSCSYPEISFPLPSHFSVCLGYCSTFSVTND